MTDEERKLVEEAEKTIERIKSECMNRTVELTEEEKILRQIEKLNQKLMTLKK
jgi:uncharacterized coiled-coil DUF342 family protein